MASVICCLCLTATESKHSFGIFTVEGKKQTWARCIGLLLEVSVSSDDGFQIFCTTVVLCIEDSLQRLQTTAQESYVRLSEHVLIDKKQTKATSRVVGVSPSTPLLCPSAKCAYLQPRALFDENANESNNLILK